MPPAQAQKLAPTGAQVENYLRLPLAFERQGGGPSERFLTRGQGYTVGLQDAKATIGVVRAAEAIGTNQVAAPESRAVSIEFVGARLAQAIPGSELPGKINYIRGNDPREWQTGLSTFERVKYPGIYPGIDVVYYGSQQQLEFDLVVKAGADPSAIRLKVAGAGKLSIDSAGALDLGEAGGGVRIALPKIYQEVNGTKKPIAGQYAIRGRDEVAFQMEAYDHSRALVIDPTIVYSALLGGGLDSNIGYGIGLDSSGNIIIAGYTYAADFPTLNPAQNSLKGSADVFVTKINPAGTALIYSTYLGGASYDITNGLAVDSAGGAWVTGYTQSTDFPTLNAAQPAHGGGSYDAFVARLNSAGVLQFSTYLGGSEQDLGYGIAVDSSGNGYVTGYSQGPFPTTAGVVQPASQSYDAFVTKYGPAGNVVYSTLVGGPSTDVGYAVAADSAGNAYVTGYSYSTTFTGAPSGGAQSSPNGSQEAFVAKLNPNATALSYFTFLGGTGNDQGKAIAVDASGNAYIAGTTTSTNLATAGAAQTALGGATDGFVAKLNASGSTFGYITYIGGSRSETMSGLAVDGSGNVYVAGYTPSANFPTVSAVQPSLPGNGVSLSQTTNSGASWSAFDSNIPGAVYDVSINPSGSSSVVMTDSGIYRTVNGGASWTQQFSLQASSYGSSFARSPGSPGTIYTTDCCSSIYKSTDDGITWNYAGNPFSQASGLVADPLTVNTLYLFGFTGPYVFKSTDGGVTWNSAAAGLPGTQVASMVATTDGVLYAATTGSGVYKSTNQGASWTLVAGLPSNSYAYANVLSASGTTVYFAYGTIYKTTDGGVTWAPTPTYVGAGGVAASPQNASVLYAFTYSNTVQESSDGGTTWNPAGTGFPAGAFYYNTNSRLFADPSNSARSLVVVPVTQAAFVAKLNSAGSAFTWSTYLGGTSAAQAYAIAADAAGNAFVTGYTSGAGFPITSSALPSGTFGAFVTKISDATGACSTLTISPGSLTIPPYGQTLNFGVVAPSGCAWTASTNQSWAVITAGASGTGSGVITIQVPYNSNSTTQSAVLTAGSQNVTITQPSGSCSFTLDQSSYTVASSGGPVSAILTATAGCPWSVTNDYSSAVFFTSASAGTGSATINLTVMPNLSTVARSFFLSVGTAQIQLVQASGILSVATTALPTGSVGVFYSTALAASGGTAPYSNWTVASGSLPPGLTLNASTGVISGTPTTLAGSPFSFAVTVSDSGGLISPAQSLSITIVTPPTFPGQSEVLASPRSTSAQPLLFPFVTNQLGFDTEIAIDNTSLDTLGTAAQGGTCTLNFYGTGAPTPSTFAMPGGIVAGGATRVFQLSSVAPGFQGYLIANCTFPLARGSGRLIYNAGQANSASETFEAQLITLPRSVPSSQSILIPFVTNQLGFDTGIVLANTSSDPFGASGATPTSGTCTLSFYGVAAPVPSTGIADPVGTLFSGTTHAFLLSAVAPGFQGYIIAQCPFGAVASSTFLAYNLTQNNGFTVSETPEVIGTPRNTASQPLLFTAVTNQNGNDTAIAIVNTSADPFSTAQSSGTCALNFYGANAPGAAFITPNIPAGTAYTTLLSVVAPGFKGYVTASCPFGLARGFSYVLGNPGINSYSEAPELVSVPRSTGTSSILFDNAVATTGNDTNIDISNTSQDSFGTAPLSGACTLFYWGTIFGSGSGLQSVQTSSSIAAGSQLSFSLAHGNIAQGIAGAPGFRGYIIADCGFPLARGTAEVTTNTPVITTTTLPASGTGVAYSTTLVGAGGSPPYSDWTVTSGSLPPGLTLNAFTGVISGTPTTETGSPFSFSVTMADSALAASAPRSLSILIGSATIVGSIEWNGNPVPGATAVLKNNGNYYSLPALVSTVAGSDGSFTISNAPAGQFTLYAVSPSTDYWLFSSHSVTLTAGQTTNAGVLTLSKIMQLTSPASGATGVSTTPTLQWVAFPGATSYSVQVFDNANSAQVFSQSTAATQIAVIPALTPGHNYQWSVYASNSNGDIAYYSAWSFTVAPASTTYTYHGNHFTGASTPYTTSDFITGYFTSPTLAANLSAVDISSSVAVFSFTDGVNTITQSHTGEAPRFVVSTDSGGNITSWDLTLINGFPPSNSAIFTCNGISTYFNSCPNSPFDESYEQNGQITGSNTSSPGTWSSSLASQTITFDAIPNQIFGVSPFPITAHSGSGAAVTFASTTPAVCKTAGAQAILLSAGTCSITANSNGATSVGQSFNVSLAHPSSTLTAPNGSPFAVGTHPLSVATGDFNGDGIPDFVTANQSDATVTVMLGNGSGGFSPASGSPFPTSGASFGVAVGDFNGDGILDLAVANGGSNNVAVLLGDGSGGFAAAVGSPLSVTGSPVAVAVGDFNGDGIEDLATTNGGNSNNVTILLGNGSGGFTAATDGPVPLSGSPQGIAVGDFNRDGIQDLAVVNGALTVLLGNGAGGFTPAAGSPFAVGSGPLGVAVGDINGDGIQDILTANTSSNNVTVLLGNGSAGFTPASGSPFAVGTNPYAVAVGDFNGDGVQDIATANGGSNDVTVLLRNSSGGFTAAAGSPYHAGSTPAYNLAVADFNRDGIEDLATVNFVDNNVTVLLGTQPPAPFSISTLTPNTASAGSGPIHVTVAGTNLTAAAKVAWIGPTGVSSTILPSLITAAQMAATLPAALLTTAGTAQMAVTDQAGAVLSNQLPFTISAALPTLSITTASLPGATPGSLYSATLTATGGNGSYTWSGSGLPAWLSLSSGGSSSGTPPNENAVTFVATVTSGSLVASQTFTISAASQTGTHNYIINTLAGQIRPSGVPGTSTFLQAPQGLAFDSAGNLYVVEVDAHIVRKIDPANTSITTVAGSSYYSAPASGIGGPALSAKFNAARYVAVDTAGNLFITDAGDCTVDRVDAATHIVSLYAGTPGTCGFAGDNGLATSAQLGSFIRGLAVDSSGVLYIADQINSRVRRVDPVTGIITTYAGNGTSSPIGDNGQATSAAVGSPGALTLDAAGNLFIGTASRIRRVDKTTGVITTYAGTGNSTYNGENLVATSANFGNVRSLGFDTAGNLYVADNTQLRIHRIDGATKLVTTIAGNGTSGLSGDGGPGTSAQFTDAEGVAVDSAGNVYFSDFIAGRIRKLTNNGAGLWTISAFAGSTGPDGFFVNPLTAFTSLPDGVATDSNSNILVSDGFDGRIRKVSSTLTNIQSIAGLGYNGGDSGDGGPATSAEFNFPGQIARDGAGNVYIPDAQSIRKIDTGGNVSTIAGLVGSTTVGSDGVSATSVGVLPQGVAVSSAGTLYFSDGMANKVWTVVGGNLQTAAGNGATGTSPNGTLATAAALNTPQGIRFDAAGNLFIADTGNGLVREVLASNGTIVTVAGNGTPGYSGDGSPATQAQVSAYDLAVAPNGDLFLGEGNEIRLVAASTGLIETVAGTGVTGFSGDGGPARSAQISGTWINLDSAGRLLIADTANNVVRRLSATSSPVVITTSSLPDGVSGTAYSATLAATGGVGGYANWALASGSLPPGLTLNASTGVISGTPTAAVLPFPFALSLTVRDSANTFSLPVNLSIHIFPFTITSITPNTTPAGTGNTSLTIAGSGLTTAAKVSFTPPGGAATLIVPSLVQAAQVAATIPATLLTTSGTAQVALADGNGVLSNQLPFTITAAAGGPQTTYTYHGNHFTSAASPYTTADAISGYFTSPALGANLIGVDITSSISAFSFTDGSVNTISSSEVAAFSGITVSTDSQGNITAWNIGLIVGSPPTNIAIFTCSGITPAGHTTICGTNFPYDQSYLQNNQISGGNNSNPGTWSAALSSQTITFNAIPNQIFGVSPFPIAAHVSSGLAVGFTSTTPAICKTAGSLLTLLSAGSCSITASSSGATSVTRSFTVSLAHPSGSFTSAAGSPFAAGTNPYAVAVGDFNGDGIQDLVTVNNGVSNSVAVLLGNGTGGFTVAAGSPFAVGTNPASVVVGDFNGDGIQDLATANQGTNNVTVLLGNGSGGFTSATGSPFAAGNGPFSLVAGDFNGDGIQDLATANYGSFSSSGIVPGNNVTVLLGNGAGGFTAATGSPFAVGTNPRSTVVGDFNGDGIQDLATGNQGSNNVTVLLGNGSGGFTAATGSPFTVGTFPNSVAVGDFNGDGIQDLATGNGGTNDVTVLLGNGAGGFTAATGSPFAVGASPYSVVLGDFNGDGIQDLAIANNGANNVTLLLGNGSGGFTAAAGSPLAVGNGPLSVAVGDFNGDGIQDLATANDGNIQFTGGTIISIPGNGVTVLLGAVTGHTSQTITFGPLSNLAYGASPFTIGATASSGLAVSFASTAPFVCTVAGNTVTITGGGGCLIVASQAGNATYAAAATVAQSFTVSPISQTITFAPLSNVSVGVSPFDLSATASSGLAVSFASTTPAVCTVTSSSPLVAARTVTIVAAGTCSITASQAGNATYTAATSVTRSFTVNKASQTIAFGTLGTVVFGTAPFTVGATASSSLAVAFASTTPAVCTVSGSTVNVVAAGTCSITASQPGDANYNPASSVPQSFTVSQAQQTITFGALSGLTLGVAPFSINATASSGLPVSFASTTISVCTVSGSTVTVVGVGTCSITASQAGNANYAPAANVTQSFAVTPPPNAVVLSLGDGTGVPGQTVELAMQIASNGASPAGFQADLNFDAAKLTFTSARAGAQTTRAGKTLTTNTLPNGDVRLLVTGLNQSSIADGIVAYASFTVNAQFTSGSTVVTPENCSSTDGSGGALATPCTAGTIRTATCDINLDGNTNVSDVQLIINEALGVAPAVHDLNGDGVVNVVDVQKVINAALGLGCILP